VANGINTFFDSVVANLHPLYLAVSSSLADDYTLDFVSVVAEDEYRLSNTSVYKSSRPDYSVGLMTKHPKLFKQYVQATKFAKKIIIYKLALDMSTSRQINVKKEMMVQSWLVSK
jgi:hypothetical protein